MAKVLRDRSLMIICQTEKHKNKALHMESMSKKTKSERRTLGENRVTRGMIKGFPVDEDLEKLKQSCYGGEVNRMKRLLKLLMEQELVAFCTYCISEIHKPWRSQSQMYELRHYIPPPLCYFKCQRYGHIVAVCKGKQRCPKCRADHRFEYCKDHGQDTHFGGEDRYIWRMWSQEDGCGNRAGQSS